MTKQFLILLSILFMGSVSQTEGQTRVWTSNGANKIQQLNGGSVSDLISSGVITPWGITVDVSGGKLYWTNITEGTIKSAELDGSNVQTVLTGLDLPRGIAIDEDTKILYWVEAGSNSPGLRSTKLNEDPLSVTDIVTTDILSPYHIALDTENEFIYWVDNATGKKLIQRVQYDGSGTETIISSVNQVAGITLDTDENKLYWGDFDDDKIYSADANAEDQNIQTVSDITGDATPWAIFIDEQSENLYWTDYLNSAIFQIDLVTSAQTELISSVSTPSGFAVYDFGTASVVIDGNPGWRMMGAPVTGVAVEDLTGINLVQGIPGIPQATGDPNLYLWDYDESSPDYPDFNGSFVPPSDGSTELQPGTGFIWYMWGPEANPDLPESKTFPLTVELTGNEVSGDVSLGTLAADWHLIANPFITDINFAEITDGTDPLGVSGSVWDPNEGSEGSYVLTTSVAMNDKLAVWQGAFIELTGETEVVVPQSAKTTGASFLKQKEQPLAGQVEFILEGSGSGGELIDKAAILYFSEHATPGWDGYDVKKLTPFSRSWSTINFVENQDGMEVLKSQHSLPYDFTGSEEIPVTIELQNVSGEFSLSWPVTHNLPPVDLWLLDRQTGKRYDLTQPGHIDFNIQNPHKEESTLEAVNAYRLPELKTLKPKGAAESMFAILINPEELPEELPTQIALNQNYPNPFNPTTQISYELPETANIRLEVFDLTGRNVATLVDRQVSAGRHQVNFDASNLSSGVYLYRLQAGSAIFTKKLTLIK